MISSGQNVRVRGAVLAVAPAAMFGVALVATPSVSAMPQEEQPTSISLTGLIRDFRERSVPQGHPDFEQLPAGGSGLYAGNIALQIGADGRPVYVGGGRKVNTQFRDVQGRNIAPHLFNCRFDSGEGQAPPSQVVILKDSAGNDAYEISFISAVFNDDGTSSWTYRVRELQGGKDLSHWNLRLELTHEVVDGAPAGYQVGVDGSTGFYGIKWDVQESFSQGEFTVQLSNQYFGEAMDVAVLAKGGNQPDVGAMFAPSGNVSSTGSPYESGGLIEDPSLNDQAGSLGSTDGGGVQSADSFNKWYNDSLPYNASRPLTITLVRQDDGTYVFDDEIAPEYSGLGGFFPIDGELFGNSGGVPDHNYHFTYELHATFTYDEDADQFFEFSGDDDVWVFVNGKLGIDLGGVHDSRDQYLDLDRMGLIDGETYTLDFFFAERHRTQSNFRVRTNILLEDQPLATITAAFD